MAAQVIDLKAFREAKKLRQQDIAEALGIDRSRLSRYEIGKERTEAFMERILLAFPEAKDFIVEEQELPQKQDYKVLLKAKDEEITYLRETVKELIELVSESQANLKAISGLNTLNNKKKTKN